MEFTTGFITVDTLIQQMIQPPFIFILNQNSSKPILQQNQNWNNKKPFASPKLVWLTLKSLITIFFIIMSPFRIFVLLSNWNANSNFEQVGFYSFSFAVGVITVWAYDTLDHHIVNMILVTPADIVSNDSRKFKQIWKIKVKSKWEKDILRSCLVCRIFSGIYKLS